MDLITLIGILGAVIILACFVLNELGKLGRDSLRYDAWNAAGSLLLISYALLTHAWPFVLLNGVWFLVSFRDVLKKLAGGGKTR